MRFNSPKLIPITGITSFKWFLSIALAAAVSVGLLQRWLCGPVTMASIQSVSGHSVPCPFHWLTGWDCPGCGLTRSLVSFFSGSVELSFYYHPLGPLFGTLLVALTCAAWFYPNLTLDALLRFVPMKVARGALVIVVAWGVLRNL